MAGVTASVDLRAQVTCPHCWQNFPPDEVLWIAAHSDLMGDPMLPSEPQRFLPSRFTVSGLAIDVKGAVCEHLACPNCHLHLPRAFLEMSPLFVSIFGSPFCGKSNYLAAMTWQLKTTLRTSFRLDFANKNPLQNQFLGDNHTKLFNNPRQDELVLIDKTQQAGELYQPVLMKGQRILLPRPLVFSVSPDKGHPAFDAAAAAQPAGQGALPVRQRRRAISARRRIVEPALQAPGGLQGEAVPVRPDAAPQIPPGLPGQIAKTRSSASRNTSTARTRCWPKLPAAFAATASRGCRSTRRFPGSSSSWSASSTPASSSAAQAAAGICP